MARTLSPFFSRTYGGFTASQEEYIGSLVDDVKRPAVIFDPMAGQGKALARYAQLGHSVILADLNPAVACLAGLRDPELIRCADELADALTAVLAQVRCRTKQISCLEFSPTWLPTPVSESLAVLGRKLSLGPNDLIKADGALWRLPPLSRFAMGIVVLAARDLATYRESDNSTWLKVGGLARVLNVRGPLLEAIQRWVTLVADAAHPGVRTKGHLRCYVGDCTRRAPRTFTKSGVDLVVTSPPYANRLDYSILWAPEVAALEALLGAAGFSIKGPQIGTAVVRGKRPSEDEIALLPATYRHALDEIRSDRASKASDTYYHPFFANYGLQLRNALIRAAEAVRPGGRMVVFVRDTTRKRTLVPVASLVTSVLRDEADLIQADTREVSIQRHIGLRRRSEVIASGSLVQRERWLTFRRRVERCASN